MIHELVNYSYNAKPLKFLKFFANRMHNDLHTMKPKPFVFRHYVIVKRVYTQLNTLTFENGTF